MAIQTNGNALVDHRTFRPSPNVRFGQPLGGNARPFLRGAAVKCNVVVNVYCHLLPFVPKQSETLPNKSMAYVVTSCHSLLVPTKPKVARVYLHRENQETLQELASKVVDLSESQILTLLVTSSLRALKANGNQLSLPLHFKVIRDAPATIPSCRI